MIVPEEEFYYVGIISMSILFYTCAVRWFKDILTFLYGWKTFGKGLKMLVWK